MYLSMSVSLLLSKLHGAQKSSRDEIMIASPCDCFHYLTESISCGAAGNGLDRKRNRGSVNSLQLLFHFPCSEHLSEEERHHSDGGYSWLPHFQVSALVGILVSLPDDARSAQHTELDAHRLQHELWVVRDFFLPLTPPPVCRLPSDSLTVGVSLPSGRLAGLYAGLGMYGSGAIRCYYFFLLDRPPELVTDQ
ncbi:hypothetical protein B0T25DRAFT_124604 [Lasiosphaeria hispida]|uniref:Uncharacterized protein n=1 Tax=Lasiosphaeria hispida TaxID=260671 RepID=A0AAJ0HS29_9PEZI|nr:hypothetical protein B0T25DRAFT_124604 [Lasiosphaeria hispida]